MITDDIADNEININIEVDRTMKLLKATIDGLYELKQVFPDSRDKMSDVENILIHYHNNIVEGKIRDEIKKVIKNE